MPYVMIAGKRLEYGLHGAGDQGPTLVFLHEGLGSLGLWRDVPQQIAESTGCAALVYSRAGYGNSDPADLPRPIRFMHDEALITLPELLRAMSIREAILIGHSDGGSIACIYAGSDPAVRVHALVLIAPHFFVEEKTIESIATAEAEYRNGDLKQRMQRHHLAVDDTFLGWTRVWLDPQFRSWNIEEFLPRIRVPVLVLQDAEDRFGTLRHVETVQKEWAGPVETVILPDCGHRPHRTKPQETCEAIAGFVNRVVRTSRSS
jgi:pimeloyl-ACP methyl ester carboxylesterase